MGGLRSATLGGSVSNFSLLGLLSVTLSGIVGNSSLFGPRSAGLSGIFGNPSLFECPSAGGLLTRLVQFPSMSSSCVSSGR